MAEKPESLMQKDGNDPCAWPELVYRLVEHFRWEPQHNGKSVSAFRTAIRRQEVPLNHLLLLLLRWSWPGMVRSLLTPFSINENAALGNVRLHPAQDTGYTQPDVRLESDTTRIYIENKLGSKIDVRQVQKYLLLHAEMDSRECRKQPYLLVLTPGPLAKSWKPYTKTGADTDAQRFIEAKVLDAPLSNLYGCAGQKLVNQYAPGYEAVKRSIRYGAATWKSIGMCLAGVCDTLNATDGRHVEIAMISDFVSELDRRGLME